jgi:hypothetical protein
MLEMSVDETVILDARDFDCFVLDRWDWSSFALATNTAYAEGTPVLSR